jgi:hypothetical protein
LISRLTETKNYDEKVRTFVEGHSGHYSKPKMCWLSCVLWPNSWQGVARIVCSFIHCCRRKNPSPRQYSTEDSSVGGSCCLSDQGRPA